MELNGLRTQLFHSCSHELIGIVILQSVCQFNWDQRFLWNLKFNSKLLQLFLVASEWTLYANFLPHADFDLG